MASLTACTHTPAPDNESVDQGRPQQRGQDQDQQTLGDAILTPAEDLNLKRTDIPAVLKELDSVYSPGRTFTCLEITGEVDRLSTVLGADDDLPEEARSSASQEASDLTKLWGRTNRLD